MSEHDTGMAREPAAETPSPAASFLRGQVLIAMPTMPDPRFERSLVYLCEHNTEGALGLIINRTAEDLTLDDLFGRLEITIQAPGVAAESLRLGGPVEPGRGFVLHTADFTVPDASLRVDDEIALTGTLDVLHAIAEGRGPRQRFVALGYAGWGPGQLENELKLNGWLACDADETLLFDTDQDPKWESALGKLGITAAMLSGGGSA
ncbi:MAG: YqgE/AlgH family protein [Pseudomonadota bacterium]